MDGSRRSGRRRCPTRHGTPPPAHLKGSAYRSTVTKKSSELKDLLVEATMKDYDSLNKAIRHEWEPRNPDATNETIGDQLKPRAS